MLTLQRRDSNTLSYYTQYSIRKDINNPQGHSKLLAIITNHINRQTPRPEANVQYVQSMLVWPTKFGTTETVQDTKAVR